MLTVKARGQISTKLNEALKPIQFDYDERFWYGFSYRHKDALVAMFGATVNNQFKIGYSFDLNVSRLIKYNVGSHELVMTFMLGRSKF